MHDPRGGLRRSARIALLLSALITTGYGVLALRILRPEALYSIDAAVKFVQARSLLKHRFLAMPIENRAAFIDPEGSFLPFKAPWVFKRSGTRQAIYSTPGAALFAPWSAFGVAALAWPAILGAGLLLFATYKFGADVPAGWALPAVLGVSTMLWFYAVQPSEHPLAVALSTAALALAAPAGIGIRRLIAAGILAGSAALLRDEAILIVPGLLLARWLAGVRGPALVRECAVIGGLVFAMLAAMAAIDLLVFQRPVAAHLQHATAPFRDYLGFEQQVPSLPGKTWHQGYEILFEYWLLGTSRVVPVLILLLIFGAGIWVRFATGSALLLLLGVGCVLVSAVLELSAILPAPKFIAGLFRLCPFLVFALLPLPPGSTPSRSRRLALKASAAYVVLAFMGLNTAGGKPLGPRLLLPIVPLLVVAAWEGIMVWTSRFRVRPLDGLVGAVGVALVVAAAVIELGSTIPAYVSRNWSDAAVVRSVLNSPSRYIVIDDALTFQLVASAYFDRIVLMTASERDAIALGERLASAHVSSFLLVSRQETPVRTFPPYSLASEEREGRLVRQLWSR